MLFNTIEFAFFFPLVFLIYWFIVNNNLKLQNFFILISSYIFYGWWDFRFLVLIAFSSLIDYTLGILIDDSTDDRKRKFLLSISLIVNLGFLAFFKYYNFFIESFVDAFSVFGVAMDPKRLNIILPVGISFYTFQTLSYTIDIYRKKLNPCKTPIQFFAYVSFFPQLVAGPIERAKNLLPQFSKPRKFEYDKATDGCRQILWGLFKKVVVADNCAVVVNDVFANYQDQPGGMLLLAAVFFSFQIYCDFSGYSDIAIGSARLLGFDLKKNFAFPYFSRDIAEFWRRWHISLSTWFRDYVYIPLGGSRVSKTLMIRNTFVIFIVSGFWHGANWTFIFWGMLNAFYFLPLLLNGKNRKYTDTVAKDNILPNLTEIFQILYTFSIVTIAWIFFRASSISDAFLYIKKMFNISIFSLNADLLGRSCMIAIGAIFILIFVEWIQRKKEHGLHYSIESNVIFRWCSYLALIVGIFYFSGEQQEFIYFQF